MTTKKPTRPRLPGPDQPLLPLPTRPEQVTLARNYDEFSSLAADIAGRLQVVRDDREPSGFAIAERPARRPAVRLLADVADHVERIGRERRIDTETLVDAVLTDWLNRQGDGR